MKQQLDYISDYKFFSSDLVSEYYILLFDCPPSNQVYFHN